ncbi:MAG: protein-L-isoaspartate family protein [Micavibrio sp.]|nr:protein-L-isoaspartate family protein [Micavibrio sp.]|tara:strand:- start:18704 stop:19366 length:663 start_codon:yes stop_codon:yes gene_type:complete
MLNFEQARSNMVDCQIHPNGVIDPRILTAFETLPREKFVPDELRGIAYNDEDLVMADGRILLEPQTHARMLQVVKPGAEEVCLVVGDGCGYASAVLAQLTAMVITITTNDAEKQRIGDLCTALDICNIATLDGNICDGAAKNAPYGVIFVNGAIADVPEKLLQQLAIGGRLVCIEKKEGQTLGEMLVVENLGEGKFSSYNHYSAGTPYIPEFKPKRVFTF